MEEDPQEWIKKLAEKCQDKADIEPHDGVLILRFPKGGEYENKD